MTELARGAVADRPWGRTLGALGLRGVSGQLTLTSDAKRYQIVFAAGAVVGAASPLASDAAVRVALTGGLVSSTQVADLARRQAAAPHRDEIDLIAELVRLAPAQALWLRRRAVAQRAARTFAIERGDFVVDDAVTLPVVPGCELDIRSVIYFGARQNLSEVRLGNELAQFGAWFRLQPSAFEDLAQFGFTEAERPVLELLKEGATLAELESAGIEARTTRAMLYALVSCSACEIGGPGRAAAAPKRPVLPAQARQSSSGLTSPGGRPAGQTPAHGVARDARHSSTPPLGSARGRGHSATPVQGLGTAHLRSGDSEAPARRRGPRDTPSRRPSPTARPVRHADPAQAADVQHLIDHRLRLVTEGVDHYTLLGIAQDTPPEGVRKAYFGLARQLHPDRLAALGIADDNRSAQRLFAQVNTAFAVLSDKQRRYDYTDVLRRGGESIVRAEQAKAEQLAMRIIEAEETFHRGESALHGGAIGDAIAAFSRAIELNPDEADYHAMLAWARFCGSPDKQLAGSATRGALEQAIARSPKSITARFYLGRVERMLGRDQEALRHFHELLRTQPHHREAASEVRVIEARLAAAATGEKPGALTRKR